MKSPCLKFNRCLAPIAKAHNIGWHRVQTARHYMTDIYTGRVLAQTIVRGNEFLKLQNANTAVF